MTLRRRTAFLRTFITHSIGVGIGIGLIASLPLHAEQMEKLGGLDVHYVIVPTMFLTPKIAAQYNIVRGKDRSMINISVLDGEQPVTAQVSGSFRNLLSQTTQLEFEEVVEDRAIYYLAPLRHDNEELLRFNVRINDHTLEFQQKLYWDQ